MNDNELLSLLKKEGKCKSNQNLLELVERLAEIMRRKKAMSVYNADKRILKERPPIEMPPEAENIY